MARISYVRCAVQKVETFRERPPFPAQYLSDGTVLRPGTHRNLRLLFQSVREFVTQHQQTGRTVRVLVADDSERRHVGFAAFSIVGRDEHSYSPTISVYDLRLSLESDFSRIELGRFRSLWDNVRGRQQIAQTLLTRLPYEPA